MRADRTFRREFLALACLALAACSSGPGGVASDASGGAPSGGAAAGGASSGGGGTTGVGGGSGGGGLVTGGGPSTGGVASSGGATAGGAGGTGGGVFVGDLSLPVSPYIVVDQFGYLPQGEKIATIRDPEVGFDAAEAFAPGATYALVDAATGFSVTTGAPVAWGDGAVDAASGDRAWTFAFSGVSAPGEYFVMDL